MQPRGNQLRIQPRDLQLLRTICATGPLTFHHASALVFSGRTPMARKRIHRLCTAGLLARTIRATAGTSTVTLTPKGARRLQVAAVGHDPSTPGAFPLAPARRKRSTRATDHDLLVLDVVSVIHNASRRKNPAAEIEYSTDSQQLQFHPRVHPHRDIVVRPDAHLALRIPSQSQHIFFVELDRSTESLNILIPRLLAYQQHYRSGDYAVGRGFSRSEYASHPFRVLVICKSPERICNIALRLVALPRPILTQVWLATISDVLANPFGPIWLRPVDFRQKAALHGTDLQSAEPVKISLLNSK